MTSRSRWFLAVLLFVPAQQANAQNGEKQPIDDPVWLRQGLEAIRVKYKLPVLSASLVVGRRVVAASAVGVRKLGDPTPVTRDDAFTIGSISKPISSLLFAVLVELGIVGFNDTMEEMFPELKEKMKPGIRTVTVRHLLSHTSGLPQAPRPFLSKVTMRNSWSAVNRKRTRWGLADARSGWFVQDRTSSPQVNLLQCRKIWEKTIWDPPWAGST